MLLFLLLQFHATEHMSNSTRMYKILEQKETSTVQRISSSLLIVTSPSSTHTHHIQTHRNRRREAK